MNKLRSADCSLGHGQSPPRSCCEILHKQLYPMPQFPSYKVGSSSHSACFMEFWDDQ